ncbi:ABC transporter ATP-binding protein [Georgenia wangjunii]|uniref:ABC transporter ATP-binding protein n=1 Tax=Georgenia wangjunii TaxID=3117730 RepID=UPI002F2696D2
MSGPVLELRGVTKHYPGVPALVGIDLVVLPGQTHAVVGLNGAGKSTLMRVLLGMTRPTAGEGRVRGRCVQAMRPRDWDGVGCLVEAPLAYAELTVAQNLWAAGRLSGLGEAEARAAARRVAEELVLTPWWERRARTLSLGNRQRVGLAGALVADPSVIVLDEPTNGLDPAGVVVVRNAILERVRAGAAVLVSSHHLDEVARIADQISVLNAGRVIGTLAPDAADIERRFFELVYADVEGAR